MKATDKKKVERYQKMLELVAASTAVNPFESEKEQREAIARAKKDFGFMVQRYFPHYANTATPQFHIEFANKVKSDPLFKGFSQWGRALAKSVVNDVLLPFWLWINDEPIYFVIIGNSGNRAEQLLEDIKAEFEANAQINKDFGTQYNPGNWRDGFFQTRGGFIGQSLGMGMNVRGLRVKHKRPTHIVADDLETKDINQNPARQEKVAKWIERDLIPTMDGTTRRFIQANNKFAPKMIQTILQERHPKWIVHQVNAYDPVTFLPTWKEKYAANYFAEIEQELGSLAARSEYNNEPHIEGTIFVQKEIQYAPLPKLNHFKIIFGYWDIAYAGTSTSDYNAVVIQGLKGRDFYVIDGFVKQSKMSVAVDYMCQYQKALPESVIVHWVFESQFWNDSVRTTIAEQERKNGCVLNIIRREVKGSKYDRILKLQPYYQNGRIFYSEKLKHSNDMQVGIGQLFGIQPSYKSHDDYPDAHQGGIAELEKYVAETSTASQSEYRSGKYESNNNFV